MPSEAIKGRFDAIFPLPASLGAARLPVKMKNESNQKASKASEASSGVAKRSRPPTSQLIPISTPFGGLLCDIEFRRRELGTSQNQAIAFVMSDDGLNFLHYVDISILV